ncbi:MAG: TonB-dependent receptor, partial [Pseudomonadota bacterium]
MKTITFFAGSLAPIVLAGVSGVAMAQATLNETATGGVERIVVTAQKREEFLEDVPSSIKVFTADEIDNLQIDTLTDIALLSPSVAINEGLSPIFTDITVRGIAGLGGSQRTFGIYIDGFEISANSTAGAAVRFDDIERIEVLRGPQGTTFGRNVIAGAFNITTRDIGDELGGYSEVKVENFGGYGLRGGVDIPIKPGMGVRASAFYDHSDGYIENIGSAGGKNDSDTYGGRLKFVGDLTDRLSVNATLTYDKHEQGLANFIPDGDLDTGLDLLVDLVDAGVNPFFAPGSIPAGPSELFPRQNDTVELNSPTGFDTENILAILRFDYAFDNMDLVWVSGYLDSEVNREEDNDLSELDAVALVQNDTADFVSTEIRLQSSGDAALSWTVGAYAAKADNLITNALFSGTEVDQFYRLPGGVPLDLIPPFPPVTLPGDVSIFPNNLQLFGDNLETEETAFALFAEVEYDITDTVSVFAGARYNRDEIEQRSSGSIELVTLSALADPDITETVPLTPEIAALQGTLAGLITLWPARLPSERVEDSFEKTTWRIGAKWEPVPDINLYGVVSTGYRPGGLQLTGGLTPPSFGPENLTNYEIGM